MTALPRPAADTVRERTVVIAGHLIAIRSAGEGSPLLYLHGVGDLGEWLPALAGLAGTFSVVRPDHPGFNASDDDPALVSVVALADRYVEFMDVLGLHRVDVVATSFGGWVAVELALRAPERIRRLVLVDPAGLPTPSSVPSLYDLDADELVVRTCGDAASLARGREREAAIQAQPELRARRACNAMTARRLAGGPALFDRALARRLPDLRTPTLVVWGDLDGLLPVELAGRWAALLPDARLHIVEGAGHLPLVDRREEFLAVVLSFLTAPEAPPAVDPHSEPAGRGGR